MKLTTVFVLSAFLPGIAGAATPDPSTAPQRLRGTIDTVSPASITLHTADGVTDTLSLSGTTRYVLVNKADLNQILPESYIGTAARGSGANMVALEVVIFPPAMRGIGEGHYPWDPLPDVTAAHAKTASSMTNGSVAGISPSPGKVKSSMTNGSVQTVSGLPGAKQISVVYHGGKQIILVLPSTPVVTLAPASYSALTQGAEIFAVAVADNGKLAAKYIAIGAKGVTPPM